MRTRVLSLLVITLFNLIVSTFGNPRPNYFDRNENPELSQWAEQHEEQVHEMANRLRTEYNRAVTHRSGQNEPTGSTSGCKTTCIPSKTWMSYTGKTQEEINQIAKELTFKLVSDLNSGKIGYNQITQPNWFENYAAHELHILQNQHYSHNNNYGAQIHIPQGTYYHKTEKKQVYEFKQDGDNIQPTYIFKPTVTTYEEKKQEMHQHSSSGYPTVYYGQGQTVEKIEKTKEEHEDIETIAHVPVYTDSYFHSSDRKEHKKMNRRPTATPAIHVSYNNQEDNAYAQNVHNTYPTTVPVVVAHKEHHIATVEKQTIPIVYKYGNNERRTDQTHQRNRTTTYRRPTATSVNSSTISRKNVTNTHVETHNRRPTVYSERKHNIYKHLKTDDGNVPNYKPRVVHKESKVSDYFRFGEGSIASETIETQNTQNHTTSSTNQQNSGHAQINYRPAYVGHQSRYNRTHGYNYTRPGGYVIPGGTSQTSQTSQSTKTSQQRRPGYAIISGGQNSQSSESSHTSHQTSQPGYVVTGGGSQNNDYIHSSQTERHRQPGYLVIGGGQQNSEISQSSSQSSQQNSRPGYIVTNGGGGSKFIQSSYVNETTQARPGYIVIPGANSNQISQTSQTSEQSSQQINRPHYVITGGGGSQTVESSHTSQNSQQGSRPGYIIKGGGTSQTVETSHSSQTTQQGGRPGFVVVGAVGPHTVEYSKINQTSQHETRPGYVVTSGGGQSTQSTHSSGTSQQIRQPGYVLVTGGGSSQTIESSHISETSHEVIQPEFIITNVGSSQIVETMHSSETLQESRRPGYVVVGGSGGSHTVESSHTSQSTQHGTQPGYVITGGGGHIVETSSSETLQQSGRPGYVVATGGGGSQTVETSHTSQTSQQGSRPGYVITGGGGQTVETSHYNQTTHQGGRPGYLVVTGGGGSQTVESSHTSETTQEGSRPGYIIAGGGGQTFETSHYNQTTQQGGRPGYLVVAGGGGSQTVESSHTSETMQKGSRPGYVITGGGGHTIETSHYNQTTQQGKRPGYLVVAGGGGSQTVESSHTSETTQEGSRPGYIIAGGGGQTFETSHYNQTTQQGGRPGYLVVAGGGGSQTVESSHTSETTQKGSRPGYVITGGGGHTIETSHYNQTTQQGGRPGYLVVAGGGGSQTVESSHTSETTQQGSRPGYVVTGGGGQTIETSHINQTSEHNRPGYIITGGGSQTIESSQTNHASQQNRPGYVVVGSGGQTSEVSHNNQTFEQTSNPGYIITGGGGSETSQTSQSNNSETETRPGFVVISGGGQNSQTSMMNQTSEQTSQPGYIVTGGGGGSQTIQTSQTSENTQENRPGYMVVGGGGSQTSQSSQSNHSSVQGNTGFLVIGGGSSQNYSQELISQMNHTGGGGVYIANGSYISGHGFQEIETNWNSSVNNKKPYIIISKDRGDQPPHQFDDYYDSEEILEKEPGIGFYPTGIKPEIGLLVTGRPPLTNQHGQHRSHSTHSSQSSHQNQKNHETHVYPESAATTTHKHHSHIIGTLPRDSRPLLEDHHHHHVNKQLVKEGSSHNIHSSLSNIKDNELRESYGFNKSKHHHGAGEHRHSGITHGQHQHSNSRQYHTESQQQHHEHRHHHGDRQIGKTEYYIIRDGRRQNVSRHERHEHEEMLKSQVNALIKNFATTVEEEIQNIDPEENHESMHGEIVFDNMEQLLLQINKLVGDDPESKKLIEQLIEKELESYQKKYRVKRSFLNLAGSTRNKPVEANYGNNLPNTPLLSGTVGKLSSFNLGANQNKDNYIIKENFYNPYDVPTHTYNTLETQNAYDLTQQTQTEDLSQLSLGLTNHSDEFTDFGQEHLEVDLSKLLTNVKPNFTHFYNSREDDDGQQTLHEHLSSLDFHNTPDAANAYELTQQTQTEDLSQLSLGLTNHSDEFTDFGQEHLKVDLSKILTNVKPNFTNFYNSREDDDGQQTLHEHLSSLDFHNTPDAENAYELTQQAQTEDLSQLALSLTSHLVKSNDSEQNYLEVDLSKLSTNVKPNFTNFYNSREDDDGQQTLHENLSSFEFHNTEDAQNAYELTQQTQTEDLSQLALGLTNQKTESTDLGKNYKLDGGNVYSGREVTNGQQKLQETPLFSFIQKTETEDLSQTASELTNQHFENAHNHKQENLILPTHSTKNINMPGTCCWRPGSPNYQPIDKLTENSKITVGPVSVNPSVRPINPVYKTIEKLPINIATSPLLSKLQSIIPHSEYIRPESKPQQIFLPNWPSTAVSYKPHLNIINQPQKCCWQPGGPNYQKIGNRINITEISVGPISQKREYEIIVPSYKATDKPLQAVDTQTQKNTICHNKPVDPINPAYIAIPITLPPLHLEKLEPPKLVNYNMPINLVNHNHDETQNSSSERQFTVNIQEPSYPEEDNFDSSSEIRENERHFELGVQQSHIVEPLEEQNYEQYLPKQPKDILTGASHTKQTDAEFLIEPLEKLSDHNENSKPVAPDRQVLINVLKPSHPEYLSTPIYDLHYIPNQSIGEPTDQSETQRHLHEEFPIIGLAPNVNGPDSSEGSIDQSKLLDIIQINHSNGQSTLDVLSPNYPGLISYDSQFTQKQSTGSVTVLAEVIPTKPFVEDEYTAGTIFQSGHFEVQLPSSVIDRPLDGSLQLDGQLSEVNPFVDKPRYTPGLPDNQLLNNVLQSSYPGYSNGSMYGSYSPKPATVGETDKPKRLPSDPVQTPVIKYNVTSQPAYKEEFQINSLSHISNYTSNHNLSKTQNISQQTEATSNYTTNIDEHGEVRSQDIENQKPKTLPQYDFGELHKQGHIKIYEYTDLIHLPHPDEVIDQTYTSQNNRSQPNIEITQNSSTPLFEQSTQYHNTVHGSDNIPMQSKPSSSKDQNNIQISQHTQLNKQSKHVQPASDENILETDHPIEKQNETVTTNSQQITTQKPIPLSSQSDNRRGDQTPFDDDDYDADFYEPNVVRKTDIYDEFLQIENTLFTQFHDDVFYTDPDAESQQLTQITTKEDFTDFVRSLQRYKRQTTVLDYITHSNQNFLVSADNDEILSQTKKR